MAVKYSTCLKTFIESGNEWRMAGEGNIMVEKMLKFVSVEQSRPSKRTARERKQDFQEIYARFDKAHATQQASRCSQCGVPFCSMHCPLQNNIPDWLKLTAEGRYQEAYEISSATNNFPEICGRICPQDRLCEGNCVIEHDFNSVTIGAVESFLTDTAFENNWVSASLPLEEKKQSVGIIGAGPAGLAAADMLRRSGYQVHVYDRHDRAGGLMMYGIPTFKLEKHIVKRRQKLLEEAGVVFHFGKNVGKVDSETEIGFSTLRSRHDALLLATGVYKAKALECIGSTLEGCILALDYLISENRAGLDEGHVQNEKNTFNAKGKNVVVIGGGDTAMDCVRTAIRQGAKSVKCLYRRDRENMPGSAREVLNAEEEGAEFIWLAMPEAILGDGHVTGVRCSPVRLGLPDASGRQAIMPSDGHSFIIEADMVIKALGFDPEPLPELWGEADLALSRWGTVKVDLDRFMSSIPGVFAAGDIVRGASLVVWAIRDGRNAAEQIALWLEQQSSVKETKKQPAKRKQVTFRHQTAE